MIKLILSSWKRRW